MRPKQSFDLPTDPETYQALTAAYTKAKGELFDKVDELAPRAREWSAQVTVEAKTLKDVLSELAQMLKILETLPGSHADMAVFASKLDGIQDETNRVYRNISMIGHLLENLEATLKR